MLISKFLYSNSWLKEPIELGNRTHKRKASAEAKVKTY